jgi:hypothetical protein
LKKDFEALLAQLEKLENGDPTTLEEWKETRRKDISVRRELAIPLAEFLDKVENSRDSELSGLKRERRSE